jgi:hypothetical protein
MHPERRQPYFGGATGRPHWRNERSHLGLIGGAGGDGNGGGDVKEISVVVA